MANFPFFLIIVACCCAVLLIYCVFLLRRIDRGVEAVRILLYHDYDREVRHEGVYKDADRVNSRATERRSA